MFFSSIRNQLVSNFTKEDEMNMKTLDRDHRRWSALPFLLAGGSLPALDTFVVSTILPTIRTDLGASAVETQLVASAFSAVYAVLLITGSRLGDLFGRRRVFVLGALGFAAASMAAALVPSVLGLIVARAFLGASAALLAPQVLASVQALFDPTERPTASSVWARRSALPGWGASCWEVFSLPGTLWD